MDDGSSDDVKDEIDSPVTSREQDAVRILLLIEGAAEPLPAPINDDPALVDAVGVMEGQLRLAEVGLLAA